MTITATIRGLSPILFSNPAGLIKTGKKTKTVIPTPEEEAESRCYHAADGSKNLILPAWNLYRSFIKASTAYKVKKRSLAPFLCGSVSFGPDELSFGTSKYEIDTRRAVVQKQGVMRSRPKLVAWSLPLQIHVDEQDIPLHPTEIPGTLLDILREAGRRIGVGDFRLEKMGPFGKYEITDWQVTENTA